MSEETEIAKQRAEVRKIRALVIPAIPNTTTKKRNDGESDTAQKELDELYQSGRLIEPPYDLEVLSSLPENNSELESV